MKTLLKNSYSYSDLIGFSVGIISLAITLHASSMGFIFKSFNVLLTYNPSRVHLIRKVAHYVNNFLCLIQVLLVVAIFGVCVYFNDKINYEDKDDEHFIVRIRYSIEIFLVARIIRMLHFACHCKIGKGFKRMIIITIFFIFLNPSLT